MSRRNSPSKRRKRRPCIEIGFGLGRIWGSSQPRSTHRPCLKRLHGAKSHCAATAWQRLALVGRCAVGFGTARLGASHWAFVTDESRCAGLRAWCALLTPAWRTGHLVDTEELRSVESALQLRGAARVVDRVALRRGRRPASRRQRRHPPRTSRSASGAPGCTRSAAWPTPGATGVTRSAPGVTRSAAWPTPGAPGATRSARRTTRPASAASATSSGARRRTGTGKNQQARADKENEACIHCPTIARAKTRSRSLRVRIGSGWIVCARRAGSRCAEVIVSTRANCVQRASCVGTLEGTAGGGRFPAPPPRGAPAPLAFRWLKFGKCFLSKTNHPHRQRARPWGIPDGGQVESRLAAKQPPAKPAKAWTRPSTLAESNSPAQSHPTPQCKRCVVLHLHAHARYFSPAARYFSPAALSFAKNACNRSTHSCCSTPGVTDSNRWFKRKSLPMLYSESSAPALGSAAP